MFSQELLIAGPTSEGKHNFIIFKFENFVIILQALRNDLGQSIFKSCENCIVGGHFACLCTSDISFTIDDFGHPRRQFKTKSRLFGTTPTFFFPLNESVHAG